MLEIEPEASWGPTSAPNHWATSPVPKEVIMSKWLKVDLFTCQLLLHMVAIDCLTESTSILCIISKPLTHGFTWMLQSRPWKYYMLYSNHTSGLWENVITKHVNSAPPQNSFKHQLKCCWWLASLYSLRRPHNEHVVMNERVPGSQRPDCCSVFFCVWFMLVVIVIEPNALLQSKGQALKVQ